MVLQDECIIWDQTDCVALRVAELDKGHIVKCSPVKSFRNIGLTPPKSSTRRALEPALQEAKSGDVTAPSESASSIDTPRGIYEPMLDPYMLGSTDYAEALEFIQHVVCGSQQEDGSVCGGALQDLRVPRRGTGGALNFKVFCNSCSK